MADDILKIDHVVKKYRLGMIGGTTLRDELQRKRAIKKGLEDPTRKIGAKHVEKSGEEFLALNDVTFSVAKGERVGIIGHNGAGKSTLLKLISRITAPSKGQIELNGRVASMLEVGTGFHPELTGRENIYLNGAILGMTKNEIDSKVEKIIDFSECRQFIDTPVKRYSSGMYVKLAFSVAAHLDSEIMIMDEVLAVGDMAFQSKCLKKMSQVSDSEGRTILYVSHNMNTIKQLCERCIVLDHGKVIFDGDVDEAINIYTGVNSKSSLSIDYTKISRLWWITSSYIRTLRAEFIDKESAMFSSDEIMKIKLTWLNEQKITDLCLRVEILELDRTPIASAVGHNLYSGNKGEETSKVFMIDIASLTPGKYAATYVLFFHNEEGEEIICDCVHGLVFEIQEEIKEYPWNRKNWGSICLPDIQIL